MSNNNKTNHPVIVKCSHCKQILSSENFANHQCDLPLTDVKRIPVIYFQDDSASGKQIMTGKGIDGILYSFVVTPRTAIPYFQKPSDVSYHEPKNRRKLTRTGKRA